MFGWAKRLIWLGLVGFCSIVLFILHSEIEAQFMLVMRLAALLALLLGWHYIVDTLTARGWVHPMRRSIAMASRWRVLGVVAILEIFVIQQVPQLMVEIFRV